MSVRRGPVFAAGTGVDQVAVADLDGNGGVDLVCLRADGRRGNELIARIDAVLRRRPSFGLADSRKASGEQHGRRLGDDHDAFADLSAKQIGRGGLTTPRPTSQNDARMISVLRAHRGTG